MKRMACIGPSLESRHYRIIAGEDIYYLAFAFISPLESEYYV